jgi:hypothetical protein
VLYERYQQALQESDVYKSWLPNGTERQLSNDIRSLLVTANCQSVFDHRSEADEVAAGLRRLRDLLHGGADLLCDYQELLLPARYFPRQVNGCGRPLCGSTACEANLEQWRRLRSAIAFYQTGEREYPTYAGLLNVNPRKEIKRQNINDMTRGRTRQFFFYSCNRSCLALYSAVVDRRAPRGMQREQPPLAQYLLDEGFNRDSTLLLLQENAQRCYGLFCRPGGSGRDASEPDLPTPHTFFVPSLPAVVSLVLELPTRLSRRFLLLQDLDDRPNRPFGIVVPNQEVRI